jgi:hypothetical protein
MVCRNHAIVVFTYLQRLQLTVFETVSSEVQTHILIHCFDWETRKWSKNMERVKERKKGSVGRKHERNDPVINFNGIFYWSASYTNITMSSLWGENIHTFRIDYHTKYMYITLYKQAYERNLNYPNNMSMYLPKILH